MISNKIYWIPILVFALLGTNEILGFDKGHLEIFKKDKILVCELKDGENFDTKKSAGEVDKLQAVCAFLKQKDSLNRKVEPVIVLWNCNDLSTASFKDKRGQAMLKTGSDFAKIVSIDYNSLNAVRDEKNRKNLSYAMQMLEEIRSDEAVV